jgi:hypothetical protein
MNFAGMACGWAGFDKETVTPPHAIVKAAVQ